MSKFLAKLGASLLLSEQELIDLIRSAPHRYKVYEIPKRKPGQFRVIAQPAKEVKGLQYWVMEHFLSTFPIHPAATAYREGKSIADNARPHRRGSFLLKLDFTDFFPSLTAHDFRRYIEKNRAGLEDSDIDALSRILFWKPKGTQRLCLSIGAPSSPLVSNLLLYDFDDRVTALCSKHDVTYTRYADDLSFSAAASANLAIVERFVTGLCKRTVSPRLTLNSEKLVRVSKKQARRITGLVITNDARVSLGRDKKRQIRAGVHHFVVGRLSKEESLKLKGMLAFVKSVEPRFLARLRKKYGAETIRQIQTLQ
jgi:RNA-directed DNA polymerase